jgi:hypothetical protein
MMPRTGPRLRWAKLLAQTGMWAAMTAALTLASVSVSRGWTFAAAGGTLVFAVLTLIVNLAAADALPGGRRWGRQRGGAGLSGRGRDGDHGPAGQPAHPWPALAAVSRLMPPPAGGDDVGTAGPATGTARPAATGVRADALHGSGSGPGASALGPAR